jgi:ankyrin repeat protein
MGNTPILIASRKGNEEILKVLIKKGADINAQDKVLTTSTTTTITATI